MITPLSKDESKNLQNQINKLEPVVLERARTILNQPAYKITSLRARIYGKLNEFTDLVNDNFFSFDDYLSKWLQGAQNKFQADKKQIYNYNIPKESKTEYIKNKASYGTIKLLQDDLVYKFIRLCIKKNFYKKLTERIRDKPAKELWNLWWGYEKVHWGLFITPVKRNGKWENDKSEIRKTEFNYWTIEHVLKSGLIDPENNDIRIFDSIKSFLDFYERDVKRLSKSTYEKEIISLYIEHIRQSKSPRKELLLIPELRYEGESKKPLYRLDFTILNSYTGEKIGIEISPASSHNSVSKIKNRTQKHVNEELKEKWEKEMKKRNSYFLKYDITTLTFTDTDLKDINEMFNTIKKYLSKRKRQIISIKKVKEDIDKLIL